MSRLLIKRTRGFTLIEVLVALVVVALGVAAVMAAMLSAARGTDRLRERAYAEWVAANQIIEARIDPSFPALGRTEGVSRMADRDWQWRQDVRATAIEGVVQIIVEVRPQGSDGWLVTLSGARGRDVVSTQSADGLWDTAERTAP
ncbi:MAG: type II secretion system minor pseudopilin GspI [Gammaproteobacteria bacterium]